MSVAAPCCSTWREEEGISGGPTKVTPHPPTTNPLGSILTDVGNTLQRPQGQVSAVDEVQR